MRLGILALQGNYQKHANVLDKLGVENIFVRYPADLESCSGLIIPGGESTTISKQINNNNLRKPIIDYSINNPIFGTCAGMIILSSTAAKKNMFPLNILDIEIERNAWGRQINSFSADINLSFSSNKSFAGLFIRAPKIIKIKEGIEIIGKYYDEPVLLTDGRHLVSSFHPELGSDTRIHNYFLKNINEKV